MQELILTKQKLVQLFASLISILVPANSLDARPRVPIMKVRVRFIATGTLIRGTWGRNEDTYLAQLLLPKENEAVLVRLVDAYPNEFPSISREVLKSESGTVLRVKRDSRCDLPFARILLRSAPGDPMALLHERLSYRPVLPRTLGPNEVLPCYTMVRR